MSVEFGAGDPDDARWQIEPFERGLRDAVGRDGRRNSHRQRGDAADTGLDAKIAVTVLRAPRRLVGKAAVADNRIRLGAGFGRGLRGEKTRDHA